MEVSDESDILPAISNMALQSVNNFRNTYNRQDAVESMCLQPVLCQLEVSDMELCVICDLILQSKDESGNVQDPLDIYWKRE